MYDRWKGGVRRPTVGEKTPPVIVPSRPALPAPSRPDARPTPRPETPANPRPETKGDTRATPRTPTRENNVYAAPDGNVLRKTPQGWQQRDRNSWKDAGQAPAKQGVDRDQQARQRAADRTTSFKTPPPSQSAPKAQPAAKDQPKRDAGADKRKEDKKDKKER
jgi:hypothetical protein